MKATASGHFETKPEALSLLLVLLARLIASKSGSQPQEGDPAAVREFHGLGCDHFRPPLYRSAKKSAGSKA